MRRSIPFECDACGAVLGQLVERDGTVYVDDGRFLIRQGGCHCHVCGKFKLFTPPKVPFETLLSRAETRPGGLITS